MRRVKSWKVVLLVWAIFVWAVPVSFAASVPQIISYQGTLTDRNGASVQDGSYNIEFNIYDVATGGSSLWKEKWDGTTSPVIVSGGIFNVMLGALSPLPANFFAEHPTSFLGIKVGADSEMLPRQRISSVGYAFAAGNGIPKGGIIMWSGAVSQIPEGWWLCDGSNGTPNLRDRFVVGAGGGYIVGATGGEATHVLTINEMPSHTHIQNEHSHTVPADGGTDNNNGPYLRFDTGHSGNPSTSSVTATNQYTGGSQAHENRPPYYALAFIMKL